MKVDCVSKQQNIGVALVCFFAHFSQDFTTYYALLIRSFLSSNWGNETKTLRQYIRSSFPQRSVLKSMFCQRRTKKIICLCQMKLSIDSRLSKCNTLLGWFEVHWEKRIYYWNSAMIWLESKLLGSSNGIQFLFIGWAFDETICETVLGKWITAISIIDI